MNSDSSSSSSSASPTRIKRASCRPRPSQRIRYRVRSVEQLTRNYQDLVPLSNPGCKRVALPTELLYEPYSFTCDSHVKQVVPEFLVARSRFLFRVQSNRVRVQVGVASFELPSKLKAEDPLPSKSKSNYSILNVYDAYGLDVACSYVSYLYYTKFYGVVDTWLLLYLRGSFMHMTGRDLYLNHTETRVEVLLLASAILLELVALDSSKFKLHYELETLADIHLPSEVLSRIVPSERLCNAITACVRHEKCSTIPKLEVVAGWSNYAQVYLLEDMSFYGRIGTPETGYVYVVTLAMSMEYEGMFALEVMPYEDYGANDICDVPLIAESLHSYANYYAAMGCDKQYCVKMVLDDLRERFTTVTEANLEQACAWLVSLLMDVGEMVEGTYNSTRITSMLHEAIEQCYTLRF